MGEASDRVEQQNANTIESKADIKNSDKLLASGKHSIMGKEIEIKEAVPKERLNCTERSERRAARFHPRKSCLSAGFTLQPATMSLLNILRVLERLLFLKWSTTEKLESRVVLVF